MLQGDKCNNENVPQSSSKRQQQQQQKQQQQQQQQHYQYHRSKPAVPIKPTNIPPVPQQIFKESSMSSSSSQSTSSSATTAILMTNYKSTTLETMTTTPTAAAATTITQMCSTQIATNIAASTSSGNTNVSSSNLLDGQQQHQNQHQHQHQQYHQHGNIQLSSSKVRPLITTAVALTTATSLSSTLTTAIETQRCIDHHYSLVTAPSSSSSISSSSSSSTTSSSAATITTITATTSLPVTATRSTAKCEFSSMSTSPNIGFGNDCCGMLLSSSNSSSQSKHEQNSDSNKYIISCQNNNNSSNHHNNNNNNGTNNISSSSSSSNSSSNNGCSGVAKICIGNASNKLVHSLNCSIKQSSTDSIDGCSSVSSSSYSGGFRDPDFVQRQKTAYNHHQQHHQHLANLTNSTKFLSTENINNKISNKSSNSITVAGSANSGGNGGGTSAISASGACNTSSPKKLTMSSTSSSSSPSSMQKLQFSQATKQIEQILSQRLATSSTTTASSSSSSQHQYQHQQMSSSYCYPVDNTNNCNSSNISTNQQQQQQQTTDSCSSINVTKQLQNKLQEEMKQQCKIIQEKHLIEKRPPQEHYKPICTSTNQQLSNRSQPAIGLKQTSKARPTIFGTVTSNHCPKDTINRRGLPQTTIKSIEKLSTLQPPSSSSASLISTIDFQKNNVEIDENALVYRDGNLISGPLDALILHMVPTSEYYPDRSYIFAFLLSARLFIRPYELLAKICELSEEQQNFSILNITSSSSLTTAGATSDQHDLDGTISFGSNNKQQQQHHQHQQHQQHHQQHLQQQQQQQQQGIDDTGSDSSNYNNSESCKQLRIFAQNFVQLLAEWIDTFPYDFRDERLMQHVRTMTRKCISINSSLRKDVSTMLQNLLQQLTALEKYEEFLQSLARGGVAGGGGAVAGGGGGGGGSNNFTSDLTDFIACNNSKSSGLGERVVDLVMISSNPSTTNSVDATIQCQQHHHHHQQQQQQQNLYNQYGSAGSGGNIPGTTTQENSITTSSSSSIINNYSVTSIDIIELCPNPSTLAHQLTHIELERLSHIGPEEFVQAFAKENPHLEQSFSDMKKTRNLESYVQWFNRLSYLVATEIVKHSKKKQRIRIVEYWIETARECFNIGNFNSLMAIIAGLNMSPISRLKKTWAKVQSAKFSVLEHQMDPSSNFNSYRSTLKAAMWRSAGATDERERIVIPFFSLLVKDLYFLNEGCSNKLPNGHINFEKFWQLAKQVTEFIAWKQVTCPFDKSPKIIMFLQTNLVMNENSLAMASFDCEPPETHEKDRYKCLKLEQQQQQQQQHNQHSQQHQLQSQQQQQQHQDHHHKQTHQHHQLHQQHHNYQ